MPMKILRSSCIALLILIASTTCTHAQALLHLYDVIDSTYPIMRASVYMTNDSGRRIENLSASEFELRDNGTVYPLLAMSCPPVTKPNPLSSVLVVDVSGSMSSGNPQNMSLAQAAAKEWVKLQAKDGSETALVSFDMDGYLNFDFTDDKYSLNSAIDQLKPQGGTVYDAGLIREPNSALSIIGTTKHHRVVIFLTDGMGACNETEVIAQAKAKGVSIYCVCVNLSAPQSLIHIAEQTGGLTFENVRSMEQIIKAYNQIYYNAISFGHCEISWRVKPECNTFHSVTLSHMPTGLTETNSYDIRDRFLPSISYSPSSVRFDSIAPGSSAVKHVTLTANGDSVVITGISPSLGLFTIENISFPITLKRGQSVGFDIRFSPQDSAMEFCSFSCTTNACVGSNYYAKGGFVGHRSSGAKLRLLKPNGGESLYAGDTCNITWTGVLPDDTLRLEFSSDRGASWTRITDSATAMHYTWIVPFVQSSICLIRAVQLYRPPAADTVLFLQSQVRDVRDICFSPDGLRVASVASNGSFRFNDGLNGRLVSTPWMLGFTPEALAWNSTGDFIGVCGADKTNAIAVLLDGASGLRVRHNLYEQVFSENGRYLSCDFTPDDQFLLLGSSYGSARAWAVRPSPDPTLNSFSIPPGHSSTIHCVRADNLFFQQPQGKRFSFISAANASTIRSIVDYDSTGGNYGLTNIQSAGTWKDIDQMWTVSPSPDGLHFAIGVLSGTLKIADTSGAFVNYTPIAGERINKCAWSPDGSHVAIGFNSGRIALWNVATQRIDRSLDTNHASLLALRWDSFGTRIVASYLNDSALIWRVESVPLQSDISDSTFRIISPQIKMKNAVDLGIVSVGSAKDSIVDAIMMLNGIGPSSHWSLDSAFIINDVNQAFGITSGTPKSFAPSTDNSLSVEFAFHPQQTGVQQADAVLWINATRYLVHLQGEGRSENLAYRQDYIDFGKVPVGASRDSLVIPLLINQSTQNYQQNSLTINGPDFKQFSVLGNAVQSINPGDSSSAQLRFHPMRNGRTSTTLEFSAISSKDPSSLVRHKITLFGEGICSSPSGTQPTLLRIEPADTVIATTQTMDLIVRVEAPSSAELAAVPDSCTLWLSFDCSTMALLDPPLNASVVNNRCVVELQTRKSGDTLLHCIMQGLLGSHDSVRLAIDSVQWYSTCPFSARGVEATVHYNDICKAGSSSRFLQGTTPLAMVLQPNPVLDQLELVLNSNEDAECELVLSDVLGNVVKQFNAQSIKRGSQRLDLDCSDLPNGSYVLSIRNHYWQRSLNFMKWN